MNAVTFFEVPADDVARATSFYGKLFGWTFAPMGPVQVTQTAGEGPRGAIRPRTTPGEGVVDYVTVDDVAAYTDRATGLGATVIVPRTAVPTQGWFAQLADTEGNAFGIWQDDDTTRPTDDAPTGGES